MIVLRLVALLVAVGLLAACAAPVVAPAGERTIYMSAVEYKGSTEVAKEAFPQAAVPAGGGYRLKEPADGKWETSVYRWEPGVIIAYQGERVTLEIWGVNGAEHPGTIEGYDVSFVVTRGNLTTVTFVADKVGSFRILCPAHHPSMTGMLIVLPRA